MGLACLWTPVTTSYVANQFLYFQKCGSAATLTLIFDLDFDLKWMWPYAYHVRHVLKNRFRHKNHSNRLKGPNYIDICMFHIPFTEHHTLVSSHCVFWSVGHIYRLWYLRLSFSNVQMYTLTEKVPKTKEKMHVNPSDYKLCCKSIPIFSKIWLCSDIDVHLWPWFWP